MAKFILSAFADEATQTVVDFNGEIVDQNAAPVSGVLPLERRWAPYVWGVASALLYGLLLNGWYVVGFVRPLTWAGALAGYAAGIPFDVVHGIATAGFLVVVWGAWGRSIKRVVAKYAL